MKNNTFAIIAIAAVAALLIATTTTLLTNDASAKKKSFHETAAQSCVNQNARCQNILDQLQGHDNAATVVGNQPTTAVSDCVKCMDSLSEELVQDLGRRFGISATSRDAILTAICEGLESGAIPFSAIEDALAPGGSTTEDVRNCLAKFKP
jgi:hypothetical protein